VPRIALLFPGPPRDPATWSGSPAGLAGGLEEAGVEVVPVRAEPASVLGAAAKYLVAAMRLHRTARSDLGPTRALSRAVARVSPELGAVYGWAGNAALRTVGPLDGLVQIGTGYVLRTNGLPVVTFEDLTVRQAVELRYPEWQLFSRRTLAARIENQRRAYERARACCVTTSWAAQSVVRDYGVPAEKVHVVGVGRNHEVRTPRRDWSMPRFLFVGKDWQGKNGAAVLRAFERLRAEVPAARLDLVGAHPPVALDGVTGHGRLPLGSEEGRRRLARLYGAATCFVMPSWYEASALVYVEAAAAGLPSIGTAVGGSRDLIGEGGMLVDPADDEALLSAMRTLANPETAARVGALAERRSALFTWRAVAERVLRALAPPGLAVDSLAEFL
jgi:glycosyltransferase involved in cell wall biosynthesis